MPPASFLFIIVIIIILFRFSFTIQVLQFNSYFKIASSDSIKNVPGVVDRGWTKSVDYFKWYDYSNDTKSSNPWTTNQDLEEITQSKYTGSRAYVQASRSLESILSLVAWFLVAMGRLCLPPYVAREFSNECRQQLGAATSKAEGASWIPFACLLVFEAVFFLGPHTAF